MSLVNHKLLHGFHHPIHPIVTLIFLLGAPFHLSSTLLCILHRGSNITTNTVVRGRVISKSIRDMGWDRIVFTRGASVHLLNFPLLGQFGLYLHGFRAHIFFGQGDKLMHFEPLA